jgi:hypothetical protein
MTLPQIMLCDPDYFWYMVEIDAFRNWDRRLGKEAADIAEKARRIKIPKTHPKKWKVQYIFAHDGSFERFYIVRADNEGELRYGTIADVIDLKIVRTRKDYDKSGNKRLIKCLKAYVLGDEHAYLTKEICERFFDDPANFAGSQKPLNRRMANRR